MFRKFILIGIAGNLIASVTQATASTVTCTGESDRQADVIILEGPGQNITGQASKWEVVANEARPIDTGIVKLHTEAWPAANSEFLYYMDGKSFSDSKFYLNIETTRPAKIDSKDGSKVYKGKIAATVPTPQGRDKTIYEDLSCKFHDRVQAINRDLK